MFDRPANEVQLESEYSAKLRSIVTGTILLGVIKVMRELHQPDMWLAGGAVRNSVWLELFGADCRLRIKDFDIAFFDKDSGREREAEMKAYMLSHLPGWEFDVKNQASFAVWRKGRFPFESTADGISNWLLTTAAVGVALSENDEIDILAPYGLADLFNGVVRPTPRQVDNPDAEAKKLELLAKCSRLRGADWVETLI
jgi:uncharacterized protein